MNKMSLAGPVRPKHFSRGGGYGRTFAGNHLRGYIKLSHAVKAFHFDFRGKTVLDIGSSTGGFTKYALDHGAKKVIAVEKGTNQMLQSIRNDPRVELHEKTNIFNVHTMQVAWAGDAPGGGPPLSVSEVGEEKARQDPPRDHTMQVAWAGDAPGGASPLSVILIDIPDLIMADVSFISLTKILTYAKNHLADTNTEYIVMLKPQFEAAPDQLNRGVVKNERIRRSIIKDFEQWLKINGFFIVNKQDNILTGKSGNRERFYHLRLSK